MLSSKEVLNLRDKRSKVLYLNIWVHDVTEAVEEKVKQTLKRSGGWKKLVACAARAASGIASPPLIASMLGEKIPQKMLELMEEKGITVAVEEVFREGPYVVFSVEVIKVNAVVLAESSESSFFQMSSLVYAGLGIIGSNNQQWVEEGYLPRVVRKRLQTAMGEILAEKLQEKKMVTETVVLGETKQAKYFFSKYQDIQSLKSLGFSFRLRNSANFRGSDSWSRFGVSSSQTTVRGIERTGCYQT